MSDGPKNYMHQSLAQAVRDHGVDTLFALVGDANLFLARKVTHPFTIIID